MGVLSGEMIKRRRDDIFESGYDEDCVDVAAYNLRIDDKKMVINGKLYNDDNPYDYRANEGFIKLPAKKISIVRTVEKLKLAPNLCARVGITFSYSRKGLIPLFGPQVDPRYNDHFYGVVYNSSNKDILLKKGDKLFKMEISTVEGEVNVGFPFKSLDFEELKSLTEEETIGKEKLEYEIEILKKDISNIKNRMDEVSAGYRNIVWFGIFLISASIFGVILSFLLSSINYANIANLMNKNLLSLAIFVVIALFIVGWILILVMIIRNTYGGGSR